MEKITNIHYDLVTSSLEGQHEVIVSFTCNNTVQKDFIFIEDKPNWKDKDYLREAKRQFDKRIKEGKIIRPKYASNKILIGMASTLGAVAITMTGLFTWKYLTSGSNTGGGGEVEEKYSVILFPGEGEFADKLPCLHYENVKKGTQLSSLENYAYPTTIDNKDFDCWMNDAGEKFYDSTVVEGNLFLTANFYEGVNYHKTQTLNELEEQVKDVEEFTDSTFQNAFKSIYNDVQGAFTNDKVSSVEQIEALRDYADSALKVVLIGYTDWMTPPDISAEFTSMLGDTLSLDENKKTIVLKVNAAYEKALAILHDDQDDQRVVTYREALVSYITEVTDEKTLHVLNIIAPSIMESTSRIVDEIEAEKLIERVKLGVDFINYFDELSDDQIKELGTLINNHIVGFSKAGNDADEYCNKAKAFFNDSYHAKEDLLKTIKYKLYFEGMASIADIGNAVSSEDYDVDLLESLIQYVYETFSNRFDAMSEDQIEPALNFALLACNACKNITSSEKDTFNALFESLFEDFLNKNEGLANLDLKTIEALTHYPNAHIQNLMREHTGEVTISSISTAREEAQEIIMSATTDLGKELVETVQIARIDSLAYSQLFNYVNNESCFPTLKLLYDNTISACQGEASEESRTNVNTLSGALVGFSKLSQTIIFYNDNGKTVCVDLFSESAYGYDNVNYYFGELVASYEWIEPEPKDVVKEYLGLILSYMPSRYRALYPIYQDRHLGLVLRQKLIDLSGAIANLNAKNLKNLFMEYKALYCDENSKHVFEYNNPLKTPQDNIYNELNRMVNLMDPNLDFFAPLESTDYIVKLHFDTIFETFQNEFYLKLCNQIYLDNLVGLRNRVVNLV